MNRFLLRRQKLQAVGTTGIQKSKRFKLSAGEITTFGAAVKMQAFEVGMIGYFKTKSHDTGIFAETNPTVMTTTWENSQKKSKVLSCGEIKPRQVF